MADLRTSVVILNWNDWRSTLTCLSSLYESAYDAFDVVLFDNGSTDDSLPNLMKWHTTIGAPGIASPKTHEGACTLVSESQRLSILSNEQNEGYTGGMNKAIMYALRKRAPDFVFLLNNDAIIHRDCLRNCLSASLKYDAAVVGALVKSADSERVLFSGGSPLRELFISSLPSTESRLPEFWETGRVEGSGTLLRADFLKNLLERFGSIFEPKFFLYGDDVDLGLRAKALGAKIFMTKSAIIYHGLAQSMGGEGNPMHYYYTTRNRIFLAHRWLPVPLKVMFHMYFPVSRMVRALQRLIQGKTDVARAIMEGVSDGYRKRTGKWKRHPN